MSKIQANKADSKEITELIKAHPSANIKTEIEEHNSHCYNLIGASLRKGLGVSTILDWRIFVLSKQDYIKETKDGQTSLKAGNFGFEQLFILHDPVQHEKEMKEAEKAAKKAKEPKE